MPARGTDDAPRAGMPVFMSSDCARGTYMTEFTIDPEFRDLLPPLADDEYQRLQLDINKNGCRDKLVVWKEWNILIDGHNRYEICNQLDIPFETIEMSFHGRDDVKLWMIKNQLARRNISDAKRVVLNLMLKPVLAAKAKENIKGGDRKSEAVKSTNQNSDELISEPLPELNTTKEIAKASGVSHDTVHKVETVMAKADEPVKAAMLAEDISINKAHKIAALPITEQAAALAEAIEQPQRKRPVAESDPPPLTEKQEANWSAARDEMFDRIRGYARRYPAAKTQIAKDLRTLIKQIENRG